MKHILEAVRHTQIFLEVFFFKVLLNTFTSYIYNRFSADLKVKDLTNSQKDKLTRILNTSNFILNTELKKKIFLIQQRFIDIKLYKGLRRLNGYPVRGQRTRSNAKTAKKLLIKLKLIK